MKQYIVVLRRIDELQIIVKAKTVDEAYGKVMDNWDDMASEAENIDEVDIDLYSITEVK